MTGPEGPNVMWMTAKAARYLHEQLGAPIPEWLSELPDDTGLEYINGTVRLMGDTSE